MPLDSKLYTVNILVLLLCLMPRYPSCVPQRFTLHLLCAGAVHCLSRHMAHPVAVSIFPGSAEAYMEAQHSHYKAACTKSVWDLMAFLVID